MNRSYRVIFNRTLGVWQCVSEIAKARGKSSSKSVLAPLAVAVAVASSPAMAKELIINSDEYHSGSTTYKHNDDNILVASEYDSQATVSLSNGATGAMTAKGDHANEEYKHISIGLKGKGTLNIDNATVQSADSIELGGYARTDNGVVTKQAEGVVNVTNMGKLNADWFLLVGAGGIGTLNINSGSSAKATEIYLAAGDTGQGTVNVDGANSKLEASLITLGAEKGTGTLNVSNDATVNADMIMVGELGHGKLQVTNGANLNVKNIARAPEAQSSHIIFDGADIRVMGNNFSGEKFFLDFTPNDRIEIGDGGLEFNTNGFDVTINPNAVIRNISTKSADEQVGFVKRGKGTLTMHFNSAHFGDVLTVRDGVLKITGKDYTMNGEELRIVLTDANNYGQLLWEGKLDVSKGKLSVKARDAVRQLINSNTATQWNDVVKATTLSGQFGQFDVVDDDGTTIQNTGINPVYEGNSVHLKLAGVTKPVQPTEPTKPVEPVTPVQPTQPVEPVQPTDPFPFHPDFPHYHAVQKTQATELGNLAKALDTMLTADTTLGAIVNLAENAEDATKPEQNAANFVASLQPVVNAKAANIIHEQQNIATQSITDRIFNTRTSIAQGSDADGHSVFKRSEDLSNQVWIQALGYSHQLDKKDQLAGYDGSSYGTVIGVDGMLTDNLRIGGAVGYSKGDLDSVGATKQSLKSDTTQGYLYADYAASEETHLNGFVSYGTSNIKTERDVTLASTTQVAKADYDSSISQAGFGIDHRIGSEHNHVSPYFQVRFTQVQTDAYAETGLSQNLSGLHYKSDKQKYHTLRHTAGVHFAKALANNVQLTGHLAGHYDQSSNDRVLMAFEGQPEQLFDANVRKAEKLAGSAGLGLRFQPSQALELGAQYSGEFRKDQQDHGAVLQLKYKF